MGIQGLIPLLEKSWKPVKISEFSGCTVAIDAYCWLHKGVYTCAEKLARGEDCQAYVYYCMRFVTMLLAQNIKPILVFDGQHLPAKAETELKRRNLREQNRKKAAELMRLDKGKEASSLLRRSIDVTHKMALNLIKKCREINVDCIVAPYEADSQLAYLNLSGIADIVITEDSDLLLFGCKKVLFKLDQNGGGLLIEQDKIHLSLNMRPEQFSFNKFRYMCILSGCDYLPSIPGVGLVKARQFISRSSDPDIYKTLSRLGSFMNVKIPPEYRDQFMNADHMFQYQPVYDPLSRQIKPLNEMSDPSLSTLISKLTNNEAYQLALGNLDPISLEVMDNWDPDIETPRKTTKNKIVKARHQSIWSKNYQPTKYKFDECNISTQEMTKGTPVCSKIAKNITPASPIGEPSSLKKSHPVTEDDIITTLEEIDENEKILNETVTDIKHVLKKSKKNDEIIEKCLVPEIDNAITENEVPAVFKQLTKRKCTVIDSEKQVVSGYFSIQNPKRNEIVEDEYINPFKCRKIIIPKNENITDDLNISLNSSNTTEENTSQIFENEKICVNTNISDINIPNTTQNQKAFSWENYSNNKTCDEQKYQKMIPHNSQNNISINDTIKTGIENDVDEGFCSQNSKESNNSKATPKQGKRSYPRTGLSKNIGKNSQTLLSKFGFKTSEKLKH